LVDDIMVIKSDEEIAAIRRPRLLQDRAMRATFEAIGRACATSRSPRSRNIALAAHGANMAPDGRGPSAVGQAVMIQPRHLQNRRRP